MSLLGHDNRTVKSWKAGAATGKARSPTVDIRVRRTISDERTNAWNADDIELRCLLAGRVRRRGTAVLHCKF